MVIREPNSAPWVRNVDLGARELSDGGSAAGAGGESAEDDADADWSVVGTAEAWLRVLDGSVNMAALLGIPGLADTAAGASGPVPALAD